MIKSAKQQRASSLMVARLILASFCAGGPISGCRCLFPRHTAAACRRRTLVKGSGAVQFRREVAPGNSATWGTLVQVRPAVCFYTWPRNAWRARPVGCTQDRNVCGIEPAEATYSGSHGTEVRFPGEVERPHSQNGSGVPRSRRLGAGQSPGAAAFLKQGDNRRNSVAEAALPEYSATLDGGTAIRRLGPETVGKSEVGCGVAF